MLFRTSASLALCRTATLAAGLTLAGLAGCGQKGPLTLPGATPPVAGSAASAPAR